MTTRKRSTKTSVAFTVEDMFKVYGLFFIHIKERDTGMTLPELDSALELDHGVLVKALVKLRVLGVVVNRFDSGAELVGVSVVGVPNMQKRNGQQLFFLSNAAAELGKYSVESSIKNDEPLADDGTLTKEDVVGFYEGIAEIVDTYMPDQVPHYCSLINALKPQS